MRSFILTVQNRITSITIPQRQHSDVSVIVPDVFNFGDGEVMEFADGSDIDAGNVIVEATSIILSV